jgi:molybdate transport system substrate-binding protein
MLRVLAGVLAGLALTAVQAPAPVITVSAAASLTDAVEAIARAYTSAGGGAVRFNFAGSNVLSRQIAGGAPIDLFVSADQAQMDLAQEAGAIDESTRIDLLGNRLAVIMARASHNPGMAALTRAGVRRIALGDPEAVPSGVYARQYFERIGLWQQLQPKIVPVGNVRAALAAVENGSADAAIVFVTDVAVSRNAPVSFVIDGPDAPRIVYPAAIPRTSRNRAEAARFLAFLRGPEAAAIFQRFGFLPAGPPASR